jgi:glucokinase
MKVPVPPESPSPKDSLRPVRPPLLSRKSTVMCVGQPKLVPDNSSPSYFILTGDIGGTNSRLTLHEVGRHETVTQGGPMPGVSVFHKEYLNCNYPTFQDLLKTFFAEAPARTQAVVPAAACFAVAGPVDGNAVAFTNRAGWVIDGNELQDSLQIPHIRLINDFVANGYGLLTLSEKETVTLQQGTPKVGAPIACLGAGTGLGECYLTCKDGVYDCWPSEGGHAEFAPRGELQIRLLHFLMAKFKATHRVSLERIVSGKGLVNVYEFLRKEFPEKANAAVDQELQAAGDLGGRVVASNAGHDDLCRQAMHIMIDVYGSEAGTVALKWLPFGGLYIAGGLAPKNLSYFTNSDLFMNSLMDKGRVTPALKQVPIKIVLAENIGQRGALLMAVRALEKMTQDDGRAFLEPSVGFAGEGPNVALKRQLTIVDDPTASDLKGQDQPYAVGNTPSIGTDTEDAIETIRL